MDPITGFLINLIIGVILSVASTLLKQAFAPAEKRGATGTRGSVQIGGKVPQYFLVGTVGEAGKLEYRNAWGEVDGVPNAYLADVYSFGDLPLSSLAGLFVSGVRCTLMDTGASEKGYPLAEYPTNLWWKYYDGLQTFADSYLIDKFGADADRPWTSDMIGRGVPYLITTALWSETLFTGFPSFMGEFQGIKLYDPRYDSTAGGSGSQRWADPTTWAFSDNNAVIIYNIERGIYYDGARIWGGSSTEAQLPYAVWAAAMDACDEAVSLVAGGTEKRFRAGRRVNLNERPADVIKELLIGANARISHASDGTIYILVGVPDIADGAFSDADVLATEPLGSIPFPNLDEIINGATATYREPEQAWEDKETAPYLRSDLEAEDDGRQQLQGLDLGTTFSGTQAQRILKAVIEEGRRFKTHVVALPPEYAQFRPLQVLAWTSDRFGYDAKLFLVTARTRSPWGQVVLGLQEVDPADHDWVPGTDEQPLSFAPVVTNRPAPQEVSGFHVEQGDDTRRPSIDVFWDTASVTVDVDFVRISHRRAGDTLERWVGLVPRPKLLSGSARVLESLLPNDPVEFQIQYIPKSGRITIESGWLPITTPNIRLGRDDIYPIDLAQLDADILAWQEEIGSSVRDSREAVQRINLLVQNFGSRDRFDKQELRQNIVAAIDGNTAEWRYEVDLLAGTDIVFGSRIEAIELTIPTLATLALTDVLQGEITTIDGQVTVNAAAITDLMGTVGYSSGQATFRMAIGYTPSAGWTAAIGLQARATSGSTWRSAGIYLESTASLARVVLDGDQIVIRAGGSVAAMFESGTTYIANARIHDLDAVNINVASLTATSGFFDNLVATWAQISTAVVGNFVAGSANIGALTVDTLNVVNGAISSVYSAVDASSVLLPNTTAYQTELSVVVPVTYGQVLVEGAITISFSAGGQTVLVHLKNNGTTIATKVIYGGSGNVPVSLFANISSPFGSNTIEIGTETTSGIPGARSRSDAAIIATNNKR
jgi:hypothetical protein